MFGNDRLSIRQFFLTCRQKQLNGDPLESLERLVVEVIAGHPEYHKLLDQGGQNLDRDFSPESGQTNPFLHMGMHITLSEQLAADRPAGVRDLYRALHDQCSGDSHSAEHLMMECLGLSLWEAQQQNRLPDDGQYLGCLRQLIKNPPPHPP